MNPPSSQTVLAVLALVVLGIVALLMIFFTVPATNKELLTFCLGALAGAITATGVSQMAHQPSKNTSITTTSSNTDLPTQP